MIVHFFRKLSPGDTQTHRGRTALTTRPLNAFGENEVEETMRETFANTTRRSQHSQEYSDPRRHCFSVTLDLDL